MSYGLQIILKQLDDVFGFTLPILGFSINQITSCLNIWYLAPLNECTWKTEILSKTRQSWILTTNLLNVRHLVYQISCKLCYNVYWSLKLESIIHGILDTRNLFDRVIILRQQVNISNNSKLRIRHHLRQWRIKECI